MTNADALVLVARTGHPAGIDAVVPVRLLSWDNDIDMTGGERVQYAHCGQEAGLPLSYEKAHVSAWHLVLAWRLS